VKRKSFGPNKINKMIDEAIDLIATDGSERLGVEVLRELAQLFKSAGSTAKAFSDLCMYIEMSAAEKSSSPFVKEKMARILSKMREEKGRIIIGGH